MASREHNPNNLSNQGSDVKSGEGGEKIVKSASDEVDHDKAFADAINAVTDMNPDLTVEAIEIPPESK